MIALAKTIYNDSKTFFFFAFPLRSALHLPHLHTINRRPLKLMQVAQYSRALLDNGLPFRKRDGSKREKGRGRNDWNAKRGAYDEHKNRKEKKTMFQGL